MDSVTQAVLGACVGEAVLGKKAKNKAILWGAIGGTIPDLDVVLNLVVGDVQSILLHRTFSHSLFVLTLLAPILGFLVSRIYWRRLKIGWKDWSWLFFWTLITHPLLDAFTNYGTMLFFPFTDYRVSWRTIFIIDPVYTLPLFIATITLLFTKNLLIRRKIAISGLTVSTLYLAMTCTIKLYVNQIVKEDLQLKELSYQKFLTTPVFFNTILWSVVVKEEGGYRVGYYALTDQTKNIDFQYIPQNAGFLKPYLENDKASSTLRKLIQFTEGYFAMEEAKKGVILNDLRFGIPAGWFDLSRDYDFSFLLYRENGQVQIKENGSTETPGKEDVQQFIKRMQGI